MTRRLKEKLNIPRLTQFTKTTTRSLSLTLATLSLSAFRLFRSFLLRTLSLFPHMDDDFFSSSPDADTNFLDLDLDRRRRRPSSSSSPPSILTPNRLRLDDYDDEDYDVDKLYLVPFRWWSEAQSVADQPGVLYNVLSNNDDDDSGGGSSDEEILLDLRKEEEASGSGDKEEGFSGREYALVSESMWLQALKWHNDSKAAKKDVYSPLAADEQSQEVLRMQIRLSVSGETNSLVVKIRLKDNTIGLYKRACNILGPMSDLQRIWDFSGQTTQFLMDKRINMPDGLRGGSSGEVPLELHLHGFSTKGRDEQSDGMAIYDKMGSSINSGLVKMNGVSDYMTPYSTLRNSKRAFSGYSIGLLGLTGLQNLGNTCFMNSAIQCLAHTPKLVDYFLGDYRKELNRENPLGMKGELALAFGELLRKLWSPGAGPVAPRMFKLKLANFAHQFSGYNQHDSQEFLAFLLDGLHEDLNRVKRKPYIEAKDAEGRPDEEVAEEYWQNHLARNDSIIVDLCQGQYRSTLVCPNCKKNSVTFDPFMYLSLPLPSTTMRTMTVTVLDTDGISLPSSVTVTVPKCGRLKNLIDALSAACSLRDDEVFLVAEIYKNKIVCILEDPSDLLGLIRDEDKLVAYRLPKDEEMSYLVVFMHERLEKSYEFERLISDRKLFGIPLVARLSNLSDGFDLQRQFLKLLSPFLMSCDDTLDESCNVGIPTNEDATMKDVLNPIVSDGEVEGGQDHSSDFQFRLEEPLPLPRSASRLNVYVFWSDEMIEKFDTILLGSLPEVCKPQLFTRMPPESVSLYKCLEAFLKEEPLGPEDMWYCPSCKKHRQAIKKLDLWRLPEILVVHLKRFSYSRFIKNKLETYVDFPIEDLHLSNYVSFKDGQFFHRYVLFAISNHYGGMGGGHYTAFIDHGHGKWFEFDDDRVFPVSEDKIKTAAAYVLFYRRVT